MRVVIYRKIEILLAECTRNIDSQLDESDEEGADVLTEQLSINPEVKDTLFNPNTKIEKLVINKRMKYK